MLGLVTSIYQLSQIVSGVILGWVGDHILGRKAVLLLSFSGSAVSYLLAGIAYQYSKEEGSRQYGIIILIVSRVIVGLVKQTMTISKAVITSLVSDSDRTKSLSHLRACGTLAFMIGPSLGGLLAKWFDRSVPAFVAAGIFAVIYLLAAMMLSPQDMSDTSGDGNKVKTQAEKQALSKSEGSPAMGVRQLLVADGLGAFTVIKFINTFFVAGLYVAHSRSVADKYSLQPHHMGYLSSAQSLISLLLQSYVIAAITRRFGERTTIRSAYVVAILLAATEACNSRIGVYLLLLPLSILSRELISQMFESIFASLVPKSEAGAALGAMGLVKSVARVAGPVYGGLLFGFLESRIGSAARPVAECVQDAVVLLALVCIPIAGGPPSSRAGDSDKDSDKGAEGRKKHGKSE